MRVGIDSYAYHRFFGEVRLGESPTDTRWTDGVADVVDAVTAAGVSSVSLETCFIGAPDDRAVSSLRRAAQRVEVVLSWGAPEGLGYGSDPQALDDLLAWLEVARASEVTLMRIVLGGPRQRGLIRSAFAPVVEALETAVDAAAQRGILLAIENHGDITAAELARVVERIGTERIGVCFDTANALRVGDDVLTAAALLAPRVAVVHLKDIEHPDSAGDVVAGPCSVAYGTGVVPLEGTLSTLADGGFDGLVCVELGQLAPEASEGALIESGLAWLARHIDGAGRGARPGEGAVGVQGRAAT